MNMHKGIVARTGLALAAAAVGITGSVSVILPAQAETTSSTFECHEGVDAQHYTCQISGTTDQPSVTLPLSLGAGVYIKTGTYPMQSGAGEMIVTKTSVTFTFNKAFLADHTAPYDYLGRFDFAVDSYRFAGPFTVTVNGKTFTDKGPGGYCNTDCQKRPIKGTFKTAWDIGDGRAYFSLVLGADKVIVGQKVTFTDRAGAGPSDCKAKIYQQQNNGNWVHIADATSTSKTEVRGNHTPSKPGAIRMEGSCAVDGSQSTYADHGTINGAELSAKTMVASAWANGRGASRSTSAPTPPNTSIITPTPNPSNNSIITPTPNPSNNSTITPTPTATSTSRPFPHNGSTQPTPTTSPSSTASPTRGEGSTSPSTEPTPTPSHKPKEPTPQLPETQTITGVETLDKIVRPLLPHTGDHGGGGAVLPYAAALLASLSALAGVVLRRKK